MNKTLSSISVLDTEDRNKRYEEAILLNGLVIKIYAPYIDAAYFDKEKNRWCLDYDRHHFVFAGNIWQEQKVKY